MSYRESRINQFSQKLQLYFFLYRTLYNWFTVVYCASDKLGGEVVCEGCEPRCDFVLPNSTENRIKKL